MRNKTLLAVCLIAALAACERPQEEAGNGDKTFSAGPEHFDRARAEQVEKEEDRLRRVNRQN